MLSIQTAKYTVYYCMGKKFWGWLNFAVFKGIGQTMINNLSDIFIRLRPCKYMYHQGNGAPSLLSSSRMTLTTTGRNSMCYSPLPSLFHWSMCTVYHCTTNLPGKERGNYTHNFACKSTKRDVSDKVLSSWNFVLIRYPTDTGANKWYRSYFLLNLILFSHKPRVYIPTFCAQLSGSTWGVQAWLCLYNVHLCGHTETSRL